MSIVPVYAIDYIYDNASGCSYRIIDDKYAEIVKADIEATSVIPSELGGHTVIKIDDSAFRIYDEWIDEYFYEYQTKPDWIIPDTISRIGDYAFRNRELDTIEIPNSVTSIGKGAFYKCVPWKNNTNENCRIDSITIPGSVDTISQDTFGKCRVKNVELRYGVSKIEKGAFMECKAENIKLPATVIKIGEKAFFDCDYLTQLDLSANPDVEIGNYAFGFRKTNNKIIKDDKFKVITVPYIHRYFRGKAVSSAKTREYIHNNKLNYSIKPDSSNSCEVYSGDTFSIDGFDATRMILPNNKNVRINSDGELAALKKGKVKARIDDGSETGAEFEINVIDNPGLMKNNKDVKAITVKKGKTADLKLTGKVSSIPNKYTSTKYAKITSKKNASTIKIRGIKKGSSTLKIKVNGVYTIKLRVKVID